MTAEKRESGAQRDILTLVTLSVICAGLWGSAFPGIKYVYRELGEVDSSMRYAFAGIRFVMAGMMVCLIYRRQIVRHLSQCETIPWRLLGLLVLFQTILQYVFFYEGIAVASGVLGSIFIGFGSIWWLVLSPVVLKTAWPDRYNWFAISVSLAGAGLAVYSPDAGEGNPLLGAFLFLMASLSGAGAALTVKFFPAGFSIALATGISLFTGGLFLVLLGISSLTEFWSLAHSGIWWMTLWLAFVSAAAFCLWNHLIRTYSVKVLAQFRFLIPLSGIVQSVVFIPGENLRWQTCVGGLMVIGAIWCTTHHNRMEIETTQK